MYIKEFKNNNIYISGISDFDLPQTLDCGQAFRWEEASGGRWKGVAYNKYLELEKLSDGTIVLYNTSEEDFNNEIQGVKTRENNQQENLDKNAMVRTAFNEISKKAVNESIANPKHANC